LLRVFVIMMVQNPVSRVTLPKYAPRDDSSARVSAAVRIGNLIGVIVPFLGVVGTMVLVWGHGFSWVQLGVFLGMYLATGLGITVGYHRLFAHRSFETPRAVAAVLAVLGSMAVEGPPLKWVATHRRHHQHSDGHDDPHSPHLHGEGLRGMLRGLWHAHIGWMFTSDPPNLFRYVPDLRKDRLLKRVSKLFPVWVALSLLIPTILGGVLTMTWKGALLGFLWGGLTRIFLIHHVTWSINSVCHLWGSRPFNSHDESRNNVVFGVLGLGEGWHNNHHAFPTSARHGLKWWQVDLSYWTIRCMEWVGLATKVRVPTPATLARKRRPLTAPTGSPGCQPSDRGSHLDVVEGR
jgi:stearoyl-CoA desaturase (delta-9 desaturase)